jgi:hypothetical protein
LEVDPLAGELPLHVFVPIEAKFAVVGKVGAKLEKERPKVAVYRVDIIVVDHRRRGLEDPRVGLAGVRAMTFLGAENRGLLLSLAD